MEFAEFVQSLENPRPVYLLLTDQEYLKKQVREACSRKVQESARAFDWNEFDLEEDSPAAVVGQAMTMPWMTPRRWVYVRNADKGADQLLEYLRDPAPRTVLILEVGKAVPEWPRIPRIELSESKNLLAWVKGRIRSESFSVQPGAAEMLVELVDDDMQRLELELEKLFLSQLESRKMTVDSVMQLVVEARERDLFELIEAIARKGREDSLRILRRLQQSGVKPQQILTLLNWSFRRLLVARERLERGEPFFEILKTLKIWSYKGRDRQIRAYSKRFLVEILLRLRDADRLSKTTSLDAQQYLERVVIDTCRDGSV